MGDVEGDRFGDGKGKIVIPMKSLSFKVGIILLSIWLFVFIGYLETFGVKRIYFCGNPPPYKSKPVRPRRKCKAKQND